MMDLTSAGYMLFMATVFILYYTVFIEKQWILLLIASLVFYSFTSPINLLFLVFTITVTYICGIQVKRRTYFLPAGIILLLLQLFIFKYSLFLLDNVGHFLPSVGSIREGLSEKLLLPIGLSFYMFQGISYMVDVHWGVREAQPNFLKHALYIAFFPQVLQGPLGEYQELAPQLYRKHEFSYLAAVNGMRRILWGFFKKLVIANNIQLIVDDVFDVRYMDYEGFLIWAFILAMYAFELYADFSGYMDIVLGSAAMLGVKMDENFNAPYLSQNVSEYWRNWHITLGRWFRTYMFYPILRSKLFTATRKKLKKAGHPKLAANCVTCAALFIVWFFTGLWHGASWNFVLYGVYYGGLMMLATVLEPVYSCWRKRYSKIAQFSQGGGIV